MGRVVNRSGYMPVGIRGGAVDIEEGHLFRCYIRFEFIKADVGEGAGKSVKGEKHDGNEGKCFFHFLKVARQGAPARGFSRKFIATPTVKIFRHL